MVAKIYTLVWLLVSGGAVFVYATGNLNELTLTVLGFTFATLIFAGLVAVLPWWVDKQYAWDY